MKYLHGLLGALLLVFSASSNATLIDDQINIEAGVLANPTLFFDLSQVLVIDPGVEATNTSFLVDVFLDVTASGFTVDISSSGGTQFEQVWALSGLDWFGQPNGIITGVLEDAGNLSGVINLDSTAHGVTFGIAQQSFEGTRSYSFDLVTSHTTVPEPSTLALFGLGWLALGYAKKSKP